MTIGWKRAASVGKGSGRVSEGLIFDTTALIDIYRGHAAIRPYFEQFKSGELQAYISVMTEAELWRGLRTSELDQHEALLSHFVVLPLRSSAARLAGSWMQNYYSTGLRWPDAFIAATANTTSLAVLTRDKRLASVLESEADFEIYG